MPEITEDVQELKRWSKQLHTSVKADQLVRNMEFDRDGLVHISDLLICTRKPVLLKKHLAQGWSDLTLWRFKFGRAFEIQVGQQFYPMHTPELEVIRDGLTGHIDLGGEPLDIECKLTWAQERSDPRSYFTTQWYWFDQMAAYTFMRGRRDMRLAVFHVQAQPNPVVFHVTWDQDELEDHWEVLQGKKEYMLEHMDAGTLPAKTTHKWACNGCAVKEICFAAED